jgi:hypothetical protein
MARVIQQRKSGPPYLLILFVFLFLVVTVLAVLFYLDGDKIKKHDEDLSKTYRAMAGSAADNPKIQEMLAEARKPDGVPVIAQMDQKLDRLTQLITGDPKGDAEGKAQDAFKRMGDQTGLALQVGKDFAKFEQMTAQLKAKDDEIAAIKKDLDAKGKELAALDQSSTAKQAELNKTIDARVKELAEVRAEREKAVAQLTADRDRDVKALNQTVAQQNDKIIRLEGENAKYKDRIAILENRKRGPTDEPELDRQPQGKVLQASGTDAAYIDLGTDSRVRAGMSFAVYPATGITKDANDWKAKILVTSVGDKFSTCRVTTLADKNAPVAAGDVVFNAAFDRTRTYKFVVVGLFDLYKTRRPDLQGAEEVKALIQRFSGVVENEVGTDTDYVVFGDEPSAPKPVEGAVAPPILPEVEKARLQYADARKKAADARIPTLNTNRFLQLTGFDPSAVTGSK